MPHLHKEHASGFTEGCVQRPRGIHDVGTCCLVASLVTEYPIQYKNFLPQGVDVEQWYGFFAPAKTPKDVIAKLNQSLNMDLADPEIIKRIEGHGADVEASTPEQLAELVKNDLQKWKTVVQRAKLQAD